MKPLTLATSENFTYLLEVAPLDALPGHHVLVIKSQWQGAKDPTERRRQFQTVVPLHDVQALHAYLGNYLSALRNS